MKKIIALAVAGAFVAPVAFADVTVSGTAKIYYLDEGFEGVSADNTIVGNDSNIVVRASDELANGWTISADFAVDTQASGDDGGHSITLAGPFGVVDFGDTSGAVDSVDGVANIFNNFDNPALGANDAALNWRLPAIAEGLTVILAYSPKNGSDQDLTGGFGVTNNYVDGSFSDDVQGFAVRYALPLGISFAYAAEDQGATQNTMYNFAFDVQGFRVAFEKSEGENAGSTENNDEVTAGSVSYSMGDVTFMYGQREVSTRDANNVMANTNDIAAIGVEYAMGPATFYAETGKDDLAEDGTTNEDFVAVGVSYSF